MEEENLVNNGGMYGRRTTRPVKSCGTRFCALNNAIMRPVPSGLFDTVVLLNIFYSFSHAHIGKQQREMIAPRPGTMQGSNRRNLSSDRISVLRILRYLPGRIPQARSHNTSIEIVQYQISFSPLCILINQHFPYAQYSSR